MKIQSIELTQSQKTKQKTKSKRNNEHSTELQQEYLTKELKKKKHNHIIKSTIPFNVQKVQ